MIIVRFAVLYSIPLTCAARPRISDTLGLKDARHPICENIMRTKFIPNDVYATQQSRFQIITGCNMSGKSTFIRTIALLSIMAQVGSL
jgi:DNA mismatch repair protein MSH4